MKLLTTALSIVILIAGVTASVVFGLRSCSNIPVEQVQKLVDVIKEAFHFTPEIRINNQVDTKFDYPVLEFSVLKREFTDEYTFEHKWGGSTKAIKLKGRFIATAGFDLNESTFINIDSEKSKVDMYLPSPRLISCELVELENMETVSGWWNWISDKDRQDAINQLTEHAGAFMENNNAFLQAAKQKFESQIGKIIKQNGGSIYYATDKAPKSPSN